MLQKLRTDLRKKLAPIKLLLINADGFLTESRTQQYYGQNSILNNGHEIKALNELGVRGVAFSTKKSEALLSITSRLGIEALHQDVSQKSGFYSKIKSEYSVSNSEIALLSGDFSDLGIIEKVNFSAAPADAPLEVKSKSYYITYGVGEESVRELAKLILKAKNPLF
jgi:Low specificity phosphatase (HAD superfamily)